MNIEEVKLKKNTSLLKVCVIFLISIVVIFVIARYIANDEFRSYVNKNILKSEVAESSLNSI